MLKKDVSIEEAFNCFRDILDSEPCAIRIEGSPGDVQALFQRMEVSIHGRGILLCKIPHAILKMKQPGLALEAMIHEEARKGSTNTKLTSPTYWDAKSGRYSIRMAYFIETTQINAPCYTLSAIHQRMEALVAMSGDLATWYFVGIDPKNPFTQQLGLDHLKVLCLI